MSAMGRPEIYSDDLAARVCAALSDGQSLRTVCKPDDMPGLTTVFKWLHEREDFAERYARAKAEAADAMAEDMQAISDDPTLDHNHKRIMVDTRKWIASKLKPKKYGEKVQLSGDDEGAPIVVTWAKPQP